MESESENVRKRILRAQKGTAEIRVRKKTPYHSDSLQFIITGEIYSFNPVNGFLFFSTILFLLRSF